LKKKEKKRAGRQDPLPGCGKEKKKKKKLGGSLRFSLSKKQKRGGGVKRRKNPCTLRCLKGRKEETQPGGSDPLQPEGEGGGKKERVH